MSRNASRMTAALTALMMLGLPVVLAAKDVPPDREEKRVVIIDDDGETMTLDWEDQALTITRQSEGRTGVTVIDMEEIGAIVGEAMEEVAETLADLQMDIHMGQDNRLNLSVDDTTFELDMDEIFAQIGEVLEMGLGEFDTDEWTHAHDRHYTERNSDELKSELDELRREMKELRRELSRLRSDDD